MTVDTEEKERKWQSGPDGGCKAHADLHPGRWVLPVRRARNDRLTEVSVVRAGDSRPYR